MNETRNRIRNSIYLCPYLNIRRLRKSIYSKHLYHIPSMLTHVKWPEKSKNARYFHSIKEIENESEVSKFKFSSQSA